MELEKQTERQSSYVRRGKPESEKLLWM